MPPTATLRTYPIAHNLDWLSSALRAPITDGATIAEAGTTMSPTATLRTYPIARNQTVYRVPSARVARRRSHRDRAPDITLRAPVTL